jgi:hypothetical protein
LNFPCSVTEYWNPAFLSRFIAKAGSIRAATKMPDFDSMPGKDIEGIVEYLKYMSGHKKAGEPQAQQVQAAGEGEASAPRKRRRRGGRGRKSGQGQAQATAAQTV